MEDHLLVHLFLKHNFSFFYHSFWNKSLKGNPKGLVPISPQELIELCVTLNEDFLFLFEYKTLNVSEVKNFHIF